MKLLALVGGVSIAALTFACGGESAPPDDVVDQRRLDIGPAPAEGEGVQFLMPETMIPPGEEHAICWIPQWVPEKDYLIKKFISYQGASGHHIFALSSLIPRRAGTTFDCTSLESMTSVAPLVTVTEAKGGDTARGDLPDDFVVRLAKDTRIVIQSHYVNTSDKPLLVRDAAEFFFFDESLPHVEYSYFVLNDGGVNITAGEHTRKTYCQVNDTFQIKWALGHMHSYGTSVKIERERNGEMTLIQDVTPWKAEYRDTGPVVNYDRDDPFMLIPGDKLHLTCTYNNTTDHNLTFPEEMCVAFTGYFPAKPDGFITCDAVEQ